MTGSSGVVTKASEGPVAKVNGATTSIKSRCSSRNSGVGLATIPASPMVPLGM